jgi:hypothetical protein
MCSLERMSCGCVEYDVPSNVETSCLVAIYFSLMETVCEACCVYLRCCESLILLVKFISLSYALFSFEKFFWK